MSHNENVENAALIAIIETQQNTIAVLSKNTEAMQATIKELQATIANLEETVAELTRRLFGTSSEQTVSPNPPVTNCMKRCRLKRSNVMYRRRTVFAPIAMPLWNISDTVLSAKNYG